MEVTTSSRGFSVTAAPPGVLRAGCEWFHRGVAWAGGLLSDMLFQIEDEFRGGVSGSGFDEAPEGNKIGNISDTMS